MPVFSYYARAKDTYYSFIGLRPRFYDIMGDFIRIYQLRAKRREHSGNRSFSATEAAGQPQD